MPTAPSLRQMRYYVAVAEERNFRAAAQRLHITQPPLSRQVAAVEAALGVVLLQRDTRGVQLTAAGEQALQEFRVLLAQADAAMARLAALGDALPRLRLGLLYWLDVNGLPALEAGLRGLGLVSAVESQLVASHEAVAAVRSGRLDAALVAAPIETQGLPSTTVAQLPLAALVPAHSALARRRVISLRDLNGGPPFLRFRRSVSPLLYDHFERQYSAHGFKPDKVVWAPELIGGLALIGAGQACTCMPMPMAVHRYAGVVQRPLRERVTVDLALVWAGHLHAPLQAGLLDAVQALVPGAVSAAAQVGARPGRTSSRVN